MEEREIQYFEKFGETILDEYGAIYSSDGIWLLAAPTGRHKNFKIKEGTQIIAHYAFWGVYDGDNCIDSCFIENVEMPDSVVYMEHDAFWECEDLKAIKLSQSIKKIPSYCFYRCLSLESIEIPKSVTIIEEGAFMWCKNLRKIILPKSIFEIEEGAFASCKSLQKIIIPSGTKNRFIKMLDNESAKCIIEDGVFY